MNDVTDLVSWIDARSVLVFLVTFLAGISVSSTRRRSCLPPGPLKWPLIGNLPQIFMYMRKHNSQLKMHLELVEKYGGIYTLSPSGDDIVVVADYDLLQEVLLYRAEEFNDRPSYRLGKDLFQGLGILSSSGEKWRAIKKLTAVAFRDFGVGNRKQEQIIQEEAEIILKMMEENRGAPFDPKPLLFKAVANVICRIIFGVRFDYEDKEFNNLLDKMNYMAKHYTPTTIDNLLPIVKYLPITTPGKVMIKNREEIRQYTYRKINEHRATYDKNNIRDYIDIYIKYTEEENDTAQLTEPHLFQAILDLYFAGMETTANTLTWLILYLINFPEVQKKCKEEIVEVVGQSRQVCYADKAKLPYVNATILELQRCSNTTAFTVPHMNPETTELGGYIIPKRTLILPLVSHPHQSKKYFENPSEFWPERWLVDGKVKKTGPFLPFGLGPHQCSGENLAKMEIFLSMTTFLQHHTFELPEGHPKPTLEGTNTGVTVNTAPYKVIFKSD